MNTPSEDIKDMLVEESNLGLTFATNLFIGVEPPSPDNSVTIFDTSSEQPDFTLDNSQYYRESIQIRVRDTSYVDGYELSKNILDSLQGRAETRNETIYSVIYCMNGPTFLDYDENGRTRFVTNYKLQRR